MNDLNQIASNVAHSLHAAVPDASIDAVIKLAKFIAVAGVAIKSCNEVLAKDGNELSPKGLDFVLGKCLELVDG